MYMHSIKSVFVISGPGTSTYGFNIDVRLSAACIRSRERKETHCSVARCHYPCRIHFGKGAENHIRDTLCRGFSVSRRRRFGCSHKTSRFCNDIDAFKKPGIGRNSIVQYGHHGVIHSRLKRARYAVIRTTYLPAGPCKIKGDAIAFDRNSCFDEKVLISCAVSSRKPRSDIPRQEVL